MVRARGMKIGFVALTCVVLLSARALAQQTSGIAGVVRDTSGAVLPGVTVEAASPALIEKVRTSVTDNEGRYNIVDLRPGTYTVTFTLPGFSTFKREGIALTSGFTAAVNADLQVGSLEETISVSGEAPLVDTSNVRKQFVASSELLDSLPTSTKHVNTLVTLTAGFTGLADVGGQYTTQIGGTAGVAGSGAFHGKTGTRLNFDGMNMENMQGIGNSSYQLNAVAVEEMVLQTSGISAESNADGAVVNVIPKEGSNTFRFTANTLYTNDHLERNNLTTELRNRGLTAVNTTGRIFDEAASVGGPLSKDRLWLLAAWRTWGFTRRYAGVYHNKTQGTPFWTPWIDRPLDRASGRWEWYDSKLVRLTWQASPRNKFNFTTDYQHACNCGSSSAATAQEAAFSYRFDPNFLFQAAWTSPLSNRLLLEAGAAATISHWHRFLISGDQSHISILDQGLGLTYNATAFYIGHPNDSDRYAERFSLSYITGSHAFKTGATIEQGVRNTLTRPTGNAVSYRFNNGVPNQITQSAAPWLQDDNFTDLGLYAQDQWTIQRLTLNLGLRFDYFYGWIPTQHVPATRFAPERNFSPVKGAPNWKDLNPRVGAAYDLFGNGRTALKISLGRYVKKVGPSITGANNPIETSVNSAFRSWEDANRNYVQDCDLGNFAANGECGAISNENFGKINPTPTRYANDVLRGFNVREFNWDMSTEVQHQLRAGVSVTAGYYRNWYGNFLATDNQLITPADFNAYCISAQADARLPGGGGYQVCGLYDVAPAKFGQVVNLVTQASHFGKPKKVNNFYNAGIQMRLATGVQFGGGFDTGRTVDDNCYVVDSPQALVNCRIVTPFEGNTQLKLNGSYRLPAGFVVSGVLQNVPGPALEALYAAPTAEIAPSLGRNLSGGTRTATVPLIKPQTQFEGRINRLDLRLTKIVRIGPKVRVQANVDAYNALNNSSIRTINTTYGSRWLYANSILDGRLIQFSSQMSF